MLKSSRSICKALGQPLLLRGKGHLVRWHEAQRRLSLGSLVGDEEQDVDNVAAAVLHRIFALLVDQNIDLQCQRPVRDKFKSRDKLRANLTSRGTYKQILE